MGMNGHDSGDDPRPSSNYPKRVYQPIDTPTFSEAIHPEIVSWSTTFSRALDNNFGAMFDMMKFIMHKLNITTDDVRKYRDKLDTMPELIEYKAKAAVAYRMPEVELRLIRDSVARDNSVRLAIIVGGIEFLREIITYLVTHHL